MDQRLRCERCGRPERLLCRVIDGVCENCQRAERRAQAPPSAPVRPIPDLPARREPRRPAAPARSAAVPPVPVSVPRGPSAWAQDLVQRPETWAVLDTETTGGTTPEIIEIAVVDGTGRTLLDTYCQPTQAINRFARQTHGISDAVVRQAAPFAACYAELGMALAGRTILAWNMGFDRSMVLQTCTRYRLAPIDTDWQCAMQAYRTYAGAGQPYNLAAACQALGVPAPSHRALRDVRATLNIIRRMAGAAPIWWEDAGACR